MKIAFHIPRMNCYRALSSLINEALHRGHYVECWHHKGVKLKENTPNLEKIPFFEHGNPTVIEYISQCDIVKLVTSRKVDIVIDIYPPRYPEIQTIKKEHGGKPLWILIDLPPSACIMEIRNEQQLYGCDKFIVCNEYYLQSSIRMAMQNKAELLNYTIRNERIIGSSPSEWVKKNYMFQWKEDHATYLLKNVFMAGNSSFDIMPHIKPDEIRYRWGLEKNKHIVSLLPFPFNYDLDAKWAQMFARDSFLSRLKWIVMFKRYESFKDIFSWPSNVAVVRSLRRFAVNNDALLIAKKRHSRDLTPELEKYCDLIVGDDQYYPHTAFELYSISDIVVGFYSTGAMEAVALKTPYLNVKFPDFPWKFYCDMRIPIHFCEPFEGVISSMTADEVIDKLPFMKLSDFKLDPDEREKYLKKYASWPLGNASKSIIDFLEHGIAN